MLRHLFRTQERKNTLNTALKVLEADKRLKARFDESEELRREKRKSSILVVLLCILIAYILVNTIF